MQKQIYKPLYYLDGMAGLPRHAGRGMTRIIVRGSRAAAERAISISAATRTRPPHAEAKMFLRHRFTSRWTRLQLAASLAEMQQVLGAGNDASVKTALGGESGQKKERAKEVAGGCAPSWTMYAVARQLYEGGKQEAGSMCPAPTRSSS